MSTVDPAGCLRELLSLAASQAALQRASLRKIRECVLELRRDERAREKQILERLESAKGDLEEKLRLRLSESRRSIRWMSRILQVIKS